MIDHIKAKQLVNLFEEKERFQKEKIFYVEISRIQMRTQTLEIFYHIKPLAKTSPHFVWHFQIQMIDSPNCLR